MNRGSYSQQKYKEDRNTLTDIAIVLDLDSTLVYTYSKEPKEGSLDFLKDPKYLKLRNRIYHKKIKIFDRNPDGSIKDPENYEEYEFWGSQRPNVQEFLCFCYKCFKYVIVWSAGHYDYVHTIVDELFKNLPFRPDLIYTHLDTINDEKLGTLKPLMRMIQKNPDMNLSLKKMIIVDDTDSTFETVNPNNGVLIPKYKPRSNPKSIQQNDEKLLQILQKLMFPEVVNSKDVRKIDLKRTFDHSAADYYKMLEDRNINYNK